MAELHVVYEPEPPPFDVEQLPVFLVTELNRIASALQTAQSGSTDVLHVAPNKPAEGMVRNADGTNWDPGDGAGLYLYSGGAWKKLLFASDITATPTATTGDARLTLKTTADTGWVLVNDGSIGSATSGATTRANADTEALFTLVWNNIIDTWAPVSTGRGASAAADFAANKTITLPLTLGRAIAIGGAGSGLTSRALGENLGTETHQLTIPELPAHSHDFNHDNAGGSGNAFWRGSAIDGALTSTTAGSDTPHNNMQPSSFWNVMLKL